MHFFCPHRRAALAAAVLPFGSEVCYCVTSGAGTVVKYGYVLIDDGSQLTICGPPPEGEQSSLLKSNVGTSQQVMLELV